MGTLTNDLNIIKKHKCYYCNSEAVGMVNQKYCCKEHARQLKAKMMEHLLINSND